MEPTVGTLKNISGEDLDVASLRRTVAAGETVEVVDELLTSPDLVWPSSTWEVNGGTHEHDPNSPENLAKAEAQRQADEEAAAQVAQEAASVPVEPEPPLSADPVSNPNPEPLADPAPADEVTE